MGPSSAFCPLLAPVYMCPIYILYIDSPGRRPKSRSWMQVILTYLNYQSVGTQWKKLPSSHIWALFCPPLVGANQIYSDGSALLLLPCILWTESGNRPTFNCRRNSAYTRPAYCLFSCTVRKPGCCCWKIYGSSRPSICIASVWSLEYAGTILSEIPKSSPPPTFPVSRSLRGEIHCSVMRWDLTIILWLIMHCPRSLWLELIPALTLANADTHAACAARGYSRSAMVPLSASVLNGPRPRRGHSRLTRWTSAVYAI